MEKVVEGKVFINGVFQDCCIGIDEGKIVKIKKILKADKHIKYKSKIILPAGVDIHVHFREPGMTHKEDWFSGSLAAAFGGVSCVFDMPNTNPQTTSIQTASDKIDIAIKKSVADFGVYAGVNNKNLSDIEKLSNFCNGFKIYLGSSTNSLLFDTKNLDTLFKNIKKTNLPVLFHAEDEKCLNKYKQKEENLIDHLKNRPSFCEFSAVKNVIDSNNNDVKTHFCHISTKEAINLIKDTKQNNITCGVTPHHCLLDIGEKNISNSFFKVNPPVRTTDVKDFLFENIVNGTIDVLESDHAPHTVEEKEKGFNESPAGIPGVETMYPLFLYLAKKEKISWKCLVSLLCENPSKIVNISKGFISEGYDADFIVIDLHDECILKSDMLHSRCGWSPFEGFKGVFPSDVIIRGQRVIKDQELTVEKGYGKKV